MRDAHRMKEKFDVSLDNRQIVSLLIAGIVVMGAVFVLGVVVGKKLAGNAQTASAPDLLSALDANAQALQEVQKEPPLTFQDELTRKAASEPEPKPAKGASAKPAAAAPTPKPAPAAAAPAPKPSPAEKLAEPVPSGLSPADEELAALAEKHPQAPAPTPAEKPAPTSAEKPKPAAPPAAVVTPKPAPGPAAQESVPTRTATPAPGGLQEAIARATQRPAEAAPGGAFSLQLSAFQTRDEAERFAARLRDRGYAPYIVAAEVPNKGTWYRVRMGSFPSKDAATRYLTDFKRETQLNAFVAGTN
jgi:DedD protein